jgi:hypothetical protein
MASMTGKVATTAMVMRRWVVKAAARLYVLSLVCAVKAARRNVAIP